MTPAASGPGVHETASSQSTWIFDVCGTLYDENTTAGFVVFFHRRQGNRLRAAAARAIGARRHPIHLALIVLGKLIDRDVGKALLLLTLRGAHRVELEAVAVAYVDALVGKGIASTRRLAGQAHAAGDAIILGSNSIDVVVGEIAGRLGAAHVSSRLGYVGDRATGWLDCETRGNKLHHVTAMLGAIARPLVVVTNNELDGDLLAAADRRMILCSGRLRPWMAAWDAEIIHH